MLKLLIQKEVSIRGIPVSVFSSVESLINSAILDEKNVIPGVAVAINPEKIMTAELDKSTKDVLLNSTLRYADGVGVCYAMGKKLGVDVTRIPGCELWLSLMKASAENRIPVYILGASADTLAKTKQRLELLGVNIVGAQDGYFQDENRVIDDILMSGAKIVTVAMGSPKQEKFIFKCKKRVPSAFYMGVGGTYDVFTGNVKRAPKMWRKLNLEWLYRLLNEPKRVFRQGKLVKFIYYYLTGKV